MKLKLIVAVYLVILITCVHSKTDSSDVAALNSMFTSLNSPAKLKGWKANGGDPCGNDWTGITCSGSSVTEIDLSGLGISGSLGYQLGNMKSLTHLDMSSNNINNNLPYQLPPKLQELDLSKNHISGNLPYSISEMADIKSIKLGHNSLNGQLNDMFQKLKKLEYLDVSSNQFTGNLPQSMSSLKGIKKMYLQNNQFTGSINVLAALPLDELDVGNNQFTGWVPESLKEIAKTGGNSWSSGAAPPPPPGTKPIPKRHKSSSSDSHSSAVKGIIIGLIVLAALALLALLIGLFSRRRKSSSSSHFYDEERDERRQFTPLASQELNHDNMRSERKDYKDNSFNSNASVDINPFKGTTASIGKQESPTERVRSFRDNEFANRLKSQRNSTRCVPYTLAELQTATANFAPGRLLGQGTIGRVYRAKYSDGKVLAVKKIDSNLFKGSNPENFSAIVTNLSRISHTNIAELVGYCAEQGHHILLYDYYRNGSIDDFLHKSDDFSKPLTWNTRIRIALGTARAIEYLHEGCSPSLIHKNIKSTNILLDLELNPHLSDYGLANFHQRTSRNLGVGYNAPECTEPSAYTVKSDVYSFGVVMLELLTGRMPTDNKRPKPEQLLVRWATPQLHDNDALANMVDPALRGLYPPKSLSRFADIIALCVQTEPEFRPPMSEVVEALVRLVQRSTMNMRDDLASSCRSQDSEY